MNHLIYLFNQWKLCKHFFFWNDCSRENLYLAMSIFVQRFYCQRSRLDTISCYTPGHNILELYNDLLLYVRFARTKTKLDI